MIPSSFC